jgi:hypothetical protein
MLKNYLISLVLFLAAIYCVHAFIFDLTKLGIASEPTAEKVYTVYDDNFIARNKYENAESYLLDKMGLEFAKKYDFVYIGKAGNRIFIKSGYFGMVLKFVSPNMRTIDELRPVIHEMIVDCWQELLTNPIFKEAVAHCGIMDDISIEPERISILLTFWDEDINRPLAPYVAQVRAHHGMVEYFYTNPATQGLLLPPTTEKYEDFAELAYILDSSTWPKVEKLFTYQDRHSDPNPQKEH